MLTVDFYRKDFSPRLALSSAAAVEWLRWGAVGGPDEACIAVAADPQAREELYSLLGCPLMVFDEHAGPAWWGYVDGVSFQHGHVVSSIGLKEMANRIQVEYGQPGEDNAGGLSWPVTDWLEDADSIEMYGVKELRLRLPGASRLQAEAYRAQVLEARRLPSIQVKVLDGLGRSPAPGRVNGIAQDPSRVRLHCRGWWRRLDCRYYANPAGRAANLCGGRQDWLGAQIADSAYAQGFTLPGSESWSAASLKLRAKKIGDPQDSLIARLCADAGGQPGLELASASISGTEISSDMRLEELHLSPHPLLQPGVLYWLVVERSGAVSGWHYYMVDTDQGGGSAYPHGTLLVWNGSAWSEHQPGADCWFQIDAGEDSASQLEKLLLSSGFFPSVEIETTAGIVSSPYRSGALTMRAEAERLLRSTESTGVRLLASIDPNRRVRVYACPTNENPSLALDSSGRLFDAHGRPLLPWNGAAGQWAALIDLAVPPSASSLLRAPGKLWVEIVTWFSDGRVEVE